MVAVPGAVPAPEALEHPGQVLGGDAVAGVGNGDGHLPRTPPDDAEGDLPAGRCVAQGVGEQVAQHLPHPLPVHVHHPGVVVDVQDEPHALGGVRLPVGLRGGAGQVAGRLRGAVQVDPALLGPGDVVDVLDQPGEASELVGHELAGGLVPLRHPVLQRLAVDGEHRDRGAHLVGEVREHPPPELLGALQPLGHGVERGRHRVHLDAGAESRDPGVVAAAGHAPRRLGERGEGPPEAAGEQPGHRRGADHGGAQGHAQDDEAGVPVGPLHVEQLGGVLGVPGHDQVLVEDRGSGQGGDRHGGEDAGGHHDGLGQEEPGGQAAGVSSAGHRATIR